MMPSGGLHDIGCRLIHPTARKRNSQKFGRFRGALKHILRWSTYSLLIKEYAAFVT
jgi:hypothetical protein